MQLNLDLLQWKCVQFASKQIIYVIVIISGKKKNLLLQFYPINKIHLIKVTNIYRLASFGF